MNNTTFIEKAFYGLTNRDSHGNLHKDNDNNIYSYGYHYPLLFRAQDNDKLVFVNVTGYSNSTSKHIQKAWSAIDYKGIAVKLNGERLPVTAHRMMILLGAQAVELKSTMDSKKRKDTQVYRGLQYDLNRVLADYETVRGAL